MSDTPGWSNPDQPGPDASRGTGGGWERGGWDGVGGPYDGAPPPASGRGGTPKPGVIPLRPLGIGEILDGSVTTIRRNPGATLGTAALVAVATQLLGLALAWFVLGNVLSGDLTEFEVTVQEDPEAALALVGELLTFGLITLGVVYLASVFLTGALTVVVGRAVLGEQMRMGEALRATLPRLPALIGLSLLVGVVVLAPFLAALAVTVFGAGTESSIGVGVGVLLILTAVPIALWLGVRLSLATPSLMLETTSESGTTRPMTVVGAMRRSAALVRLSWWRVFGVLLLIGLIGTVINAVFTVPFDQIGVNLVSDVFVGVLISTIGGILASTLSVPFIAAATVLLYIDRRIRSEGLDIELAAAVGIELPGRTDPGPTSGGWTGEQPPR